jgi:hypothetical protein
MQKSSKRAHSPEVPAKTKRKASAPQPSPDTEELTYEVGEKILCQSIDDGHFYEAKILMDKKEDDEIGYMVHYQVSPYLINLSTFLGLEQAL